MTDKNIYTIALKYGIDNIKNGIAYTELLEHLKTNGISLEASFQRYFHIWFYENFFMENIYQQIKDFNANMGYLSEGTLIQYDNKKAIITGEAHQAYLDYQEMKFAFDASKDANRKATIAIYVTIFVGILQILVSVFTSCNN